MESRKVFITSCVIPIVVILLFMWIIKILFGFDISVPVKKSGLLGGGKGHGEQHLPELGDEDDGVV